MAGVMDRATLELLDRTAAARFRRGVVAVGRASEIIARQIRHELALAREAAKVRREERERLGCLTNREIDRLK